MQSPVAISFTRCSLPQGVWIWLCLSWCLFALPGCSFKTVYNHADWLILWSLDDYVDLTPQQKAFLRGKIPEHWTWHRHYELLQYNKFLKNVQLKAKNDLTLSEIQNIWAEIRSFRETLAKRLIPDAVALLHQLEPTQWEYLEAQFAERNQAIQERLEWSEAERRQYRMEKILDFLEDEIGEFSTEQRTALQKELDQIPETTQDWLQQRQKRQQELLQLLRNQATPAELEAFLYRVLVKYDETWTPEQRLALERSQQAALVIFQLLTPEQHQTAQRRLQQWRNDLKDLAKSSEAH